MKIALHLLPILVKVLLWSQTLQIQLPLVVLLPQIGYVFRSDKGGNINSRVGKLSFTSDGIIENIAALWFAVLKAKPVGVKGEYIRSVSLCATMSPAVTLDINDIMLQADSLASASNLEKV